MICQLQKGYQLSTVLHCTSAELRYHLYAWHMSCYHLVSQDSGLMWSGERNFLLSKHQIYSFKANTTHQPDVSTIEIVVQHLGFSKGWIPLNKYFAEFCWFAVWIFPKVWFLFSFMWEKNTHTWCVDFIVLYIAFLPKQLHLKHVENRATLSVDINWPCPILAFFWFQNSENNWERVYTVVSRFHENPLVLDKFACAYPFICSFQDKKKNVFTFLDQRINLFFTFR